MGYNDNYNNNQEYNNRSNNRNNRNNYSNNSRGNNYNSNRSNNYNRNNNNNRNNYNNDFQPRENNGTPNRRNNNPNVGFDFTAYVREGFPIQDMDGNKIDISGNFSGELASKAVQMALFAADKSQYMDEIKKDPKKYTEFYESLKEWALEIINNNIDGTKFEMDYVNQHMNDLEGLVGLTVFVGQQFDFSFSLAKALRGIKDKGLRNNIEAGINNADNR